MTPKDRQRAKHLRTHFNISPAEYDVILAHQNGVCAITGRASNRFNVDHDHKTGLVRGILDWRINQALEQFGDNPEWLRAAADYLENPPVTEALGEKVYGQLGSQSIMAKNRRYGPNKTKLPQERK